MRRYSNLFQTVLLALLGIVLIIQLAYSLRWQITLDEAPLLYESFLMQQGRMPYRDIFDFQMPGAFLVYAALGLISGFRDLPLRIIDIVIFIALSSFTFAFMKKFGTAPALAAVFLFGLKYMQGGAYMSLQREYLLLFLIVIVLWMNLRGEANWRIRFLSGILFGIASIIKPHAAIGLLPIFFFDLADLVKQSKLTRESASSTCGSSASSEVELLDSANKVNVSPLRASALILLPLGIGFFIPILLAILWLAWTGALLPFMNIALNYWGLYSQINGYLQVTDASAKIQFTLMRLFFMDGNWVWLIPAALGVYFLPADKKRPAYLLASLALCYAIYPALSGQFFTYHYIPFVYFITALAALVMSGVQKFYFWRLMILLAVIVANIRPSSAFARQLIGVSISPINDRADEITAYLDENLQAGDTVQPLDWTGGTLLAMLRTRAPLATSYVFDFYFYHHVSDPYIQSLRADFMSELQDAKPRFIVEVTSEDKPWVTGLDTSREFPELRQFLARNYKVIISKTDYQIYERK